MTLSAALSHRQTSVYIALHSHVSYRWIYKGRCTDKRDKEFTILFFTLSSQAYYSIKIENRPKFAFHVIIKKYWT